MSPVVGTRTGKTLIAAQRENDGAFSPRHEKRCIEFQEENMEGTIDNIKVRVRTHDPQNVESVECKTIDEAIQYLKSLRT